MSSSSKLANKVALVTGASKGIGAAIAKHLAAAGASVVVNYSSSKAGADKVVAEITAAGGKAVAAYDPFRDDPTFRLRGESGFYDGAYFYAIARDPVATGEAMIAFTSRCALATQRPRLRTGDLDPLRRPWREIP